MTPVNLAMLRAMTPNAAETKKKIPIARMAVTMEKKNQSKERFAVIHTLYGFIFELSGRSPHEGKCVRVLLQE